jgi:hypothetical protein
MSRTNLFQMTLWEKISVRKFQNPAFCKQHAQIVSAKRSKIRQRHGMHRRERKPTTLHRSFRCPRWAPLLTSIIRLVPDRVNEEVLGFINA